MQSRASSKIVLSPRQARKCARRPFDGAPAWAGACPAKFEQSSFIPDKARWTRRADALSLTCMNRWHFGDAPSPPRNPSRCNAPISLYFSSSLFPPPQSKLSLYYQAREKVERRTSYFAGRAPGALSASWPHDYGFPRGASPVYARNIGARREGGVMKNTGGGIAGQSRANFR